MTNRNSTTATILGKSDSRVKFDTDEGWHKAINFQRAGVGRALISAGRLNDAGCDVILNKHRHSNEERSGAEVKEKRWCVHPHDVDKSAAERKKSREKC